jgi:hypothetical protein
MRMSAPGNQSVPKSLVIPFPLVVSNEPQENAAQARLPKENQPVQARLFDCADEPFRVGIQVSESAAAASRVSLPPLQRTS